MNYGRDTSRRSTRFAEGGRATESRLSRELGASLPSRAGSRRVEVRETACMWEELAWADRCRRLHPIDGKCAKLTFKTQRRISCRGNAANRFFILVGLNGASCSDIRQRWNLLELQKAVWGGIYLTCSAESQESCMGDVQQQGHVLEWMFLAAGPAQLLLVRPEQARPWAQCRSAQTTTSGASQHLKLRKRSWKTRHKPVGVE